MGDARQPRGPADGGYGGDETRCRNGAIGGSSHGQWARAGNRPATGATGSPFAAGTAEHREPRACRSSAGGRPAPQAGCAARPEPTDSQRDPKDTALPAFHFPNLPQLAGIRGGGRDRTGTLRTRSLRRGRGRKLRLLRAGCFDERLTAALLASQIITDVLSYGHYAFSYALHQALSHLPYFRRGCPALSRVTPSAAMPPTVTAQRIRQLASEVGRERSINSGGSRNESRTRAARR